MDNDGPFVQFQETTSSVNDPLLINAFRFKADNGNGSFTDIMNMGSSGSIKIGKDPFNIPVSNDYNVLISGKSTNSLRGSGLYVRNSTATKIQYGIFAEAFPGQALATYGIYAEVNNPGINDYAGYFNGDVFTSGFYVSSDKRLKKDIKQEDNALEKIMKLKPVSYLYDKNASKWLNLEYNKTSHGFIADEVLEVFPEMVKEFAEQVKGNDKEVELTRMFKSVNYLQLISVLTKGMQEQQIQIEELKTQLKSASTNNTFVLTDKTNLPAEIENKAFTISQNTPNPFSDKTTISYTIPSNVKKATLVVFDMTGKMLLQYNLQAGKNNLVINGNTLQAGMYLYSLLANGQEVLSKRMVLTK